MKLQNLSVRAFLRKIVAGTLLTAALLLLIFFLLTKDVRVVICGIILTAAFYIWGMVFLHYFQKKLSLFTDGLCQTLDHMMDSTDRPQVDYEAETLLSRISHRLERLYNVMQKTRHMAEGEKEVVFDGCRSRILCCQEQIGCDKIRLLYGVITSSSAGKVQRSGDLLQTSDLENIIAVIAIRGPGAFGIGKHQMSVSLEFDLQHGKGQPFAILNDLRQLALLSFPDAILPERKGNLQIPLPYFGVYIFLPQIQKQGKDNDSQQLYHGSNLSVGTGTVERMFSILPAAEPVSEPKLHTSLWASTGTARVRTSSGIT